MAIVSAHFSHPVQTPCVDLMRRSAVFFSTAETDAERLSYKSTLGLCTKCDGLEGVSKIETGQREGQNKFTWLSLVNRTCELLTAGNWKPLMLTRLIETVSSFTFFFPPLESCHVTQIAQETNPVYC